MSIKAGDVVRPKSGGQCMVVERIDEDGAARCSYDLFGREYEWWHVNALRPCRRFLWWWL